MHTLRHVACIVILATSFPAGDARADAANPDPESQSCSGIAEGGACKFACGSGCTVDNDDDCFSESDCPNRLNDRVNCGTCATSFPGCRRDLPDGGEGEGEGEPDCSADNEVDCALVIGCEWPVEFRCENIFDCDDPPLACACTAATTSKTRPTMLFWSGGSAAFAVFVVVDRLRSRRRTRNAQGL